MNARTLMLCDFDGTVSARDVGHEVIKRFMAGDWVEIDEAYAAGTIGSRAAYQRIAALLKVSREEMAEYTESISGLDPHFSEFYRFCRSRGFEVKIVSDGLDFYIDFILKRYGFEDIEFYSNTIRFHENQSVTIEFPRFNEKCARCGTCKRMLLEQYRAHFDTIIYIGDGYSDVCPSQHADLVFGKDILFEKCLQREKACIYYRDFRDVREFIEKNGRLREAGQGDRTVS
jgi:2-hydroxy-3-keto-5-methylthiopentenyl-1-phosphate phosphatase